jgi:hypothetical protein
MPTKDRCFLAAVVIGSVLASGVATAADKVLYDNGAIRGAQNGFQISDANQKVANAFTLRGDSVVTGFTFGAWIAGDGKMKAVDWAIVAKPSMAVGGKAAKVTSQFLFTNSMGYRIYSITVAIPPTPLEAGDYFLELQGARMPGGGAAYWDEVDGPSRAWDDGQFLKGGPGGWGLLCPKPHCSEAFTVLGH